MLSIYHIMLLAVCTAQVKKESKKEKEKKNIRSRKIALREFEPRPSEYVKTKNGGFYPLDQLGNPC